MKVTYMRTAGGVVAGHQILIHDMSFRVEGFTYVGTMFQSYNEPIAFISNEGIILISRTTQLLDYSRTTLRYLSIFLNKSLKEITEDVTNKKYTFVENSGGSL